MRKLLGTSLLALSFACGGTAWMHAQQLQSDGTMSPQAAQQQQAPADQGMHRGRHAQDPAHQTKHLAKKLGLNADQTAQLQPIFADRDAKIAALRSDQSLDPKSRHRQMRAIGQDVDSRVNALLTPPQQQLYADMRASHHHHGRGADAPAPAPQG